MLIIIEGIYMYTKLGQVVHCQKGKLNKKKNK